MSEVHSRIWLIRHGETDWSIAGRHTGRSDPPLNARGQQQAARLRERLLGRVFDRVLSSPLQRARDTCGLAGYAAVAQLDDELCEWDYGEYEGRTRAQILAQRPGWSLWRDGAPQGEDPQQISARAERVLARLRQLSGDVAVFAHGHLLRVLAARYVGWTPAAGERLSLHTASISVLGHEHEAPAIERWNDAADRLMDLPR